MQPHPRPLDVLVVEDTEDDIVLITRGLQQLGVGRIDVARSGRQALQMLRQLNAPVTQRLVLCDILMPDMDGLTFLEAVRSDEQLKALPIVFLTAMADAEKQRAAYSLQAGGFVVKPQPPDSFADVLRTVITYWTAAELP